MKKSDAIEVARLIDDARYEVSKLQNVDTEDVLKNLNKAGQIMRNYVADFEIIIGLACEEYEKNKLDGCKKGNHLTQ